MFPVVLNLKGKRALVFGGGKVAERRAIKLLKAGAKVTVVSMDFTDALKKLKTPSLKLVEKEVKSGRKFIKNADVVLIATDDKKLNDRLEKECEECGKIVNRADRAAGFIIPATIEAGDVIISISTKGKSPAVTKAIKTRIKKTLAKEDVLLIELQEFARRELKAKIKNQEERKRILRELINRSDIIEYLKKGNAERGREEVRRIVNAYCKR